MWIAALLLTPSPGVIVVDFRVKKPISPYIYGVNHPEEDLGIAYPLARQGGNRMSAYNWETNASNAGSDYRHQNDGYLGETNEPGWTARMFWERAHRNGAVALLTVPAMGRVSADKAADGDVNQTPDYLETRFHRSLPRKPGGKFAYPPDRTDKFVYQDEFVAWAEGRKALGKRLWYSIDNEPDLWGHTHQRVWPKNPTYAQILQIGQDYASAIKRVAPESLVFGPANYGWQGFRNFQGAPDANGRDFLNFYLAGMRQAHREQGRRLLDVVDIHWYPEAHGDGKRVTLSGGEDGPGTQEARIQCPRALWDPTFREDSWIQRTLGNEPIRLLPRVQGQIASHYPGTKLGITEYDYGGGNHVSGLLAQADVLGAFGRYGVFAATHWGIRKDRRATVGGFQAFRNMDGRGLRFGAQGLAVQGQTPARNALYAAQDGRTVTMVAINKTQAPQDFVVDLRGFRPARAELFVRDAANLVDPVKGQVEVVGGNVRFLLPPRSVGSIRVMP